MENQEPSISTLRLTDGSTVKLEYHTSLSSSSALAKEYASKGYPDKYVIITENQTTSTFPWTKSTQEQSVPGIFISILLRPTLFPSQLGAISPLSSTALLTALSEHTDKDLGIGWLSDIYCEGERIGGVNVEGKFDSFKGLEYLIVSFAVNFDNYYFPPRLSDLIRKVFETENESVKVIVAKYIVNRFFEVYRDIKSPDKHSKVYKRKFILTGKKIKYIKDGKKKSCKVIGIDNNFSLLCTDSSGNEIKISSPSQVIIPNRIK